ncbi:MAG: hypothetical protein ABI833_00585 [Acidobacteriota bacterium]
MEYFTLLGAATVVIVALAAALYLQRRDLGLVVGIAALYYWSLYGAWSIILDKTGGFSGQHYHYLETKMFPIALDEQYLLTLALYAGFIILVELTLLAGLSHKRERPIPRLVLRHEAILFAGFAAGLVSFLVIRNQLSFAWATHTSAYSYTRANGGQWFTLHQVLNRVALIPPAIGLATLAAGRRSRFFVNVSRRYTFWAYLVLAAAMGAFTLVLGNKNEVFTALLTGILAYAGSVRRPKWWKLGLVLIAGLWFLAAVDFFRATPVSRIGEAVFTRGQNSDDVSHFVTTSNEAFAAHFSMYGVLAAGTTPQFGYSLYSLACSVVPRVLWPERPRDIYLYYSESVGTIQNQGYSLHHATGWYLNFGIAGVALGAMLLGLIWTACLNAHQRIRRRSGLLYRLFAIIGPWVLVAGLPPLIRAGPEGYKGLLIESFLIPLGVLLVACRPRRSARRVGRTHETVSFRADPVPQ